MHQILSQLVPDRILRCWLPAEDAGLSYTDRPIPVNVWLVAFVQMQYAALLTGSSAVG